MKRKTNPGFLSRLGGSLSRFTKRLGNTANNLVLKRNFQDKINPEDVKFAKANKNMYSGINQRTNIGTLRFRPGFSTEYHGVWMNPRMMIIAFRGTRPIDPRDLSSDWSLIQGEGETDERFKDELAFVQRMMNNFPNIPIYLTGYSLGGGIVNYINSKTGLPGVTFNSGTNAKNLTDRAIDSLLQGDNVRRYRTHNDVVSLGEATTASNVITIPGHPNTIKTHRIEMFL